MAVKPKSWWECRAIEGVAGHKAQADLRVRRYGRA